MSVVTTAWINCDKCGVSFGAEDITQASPLHIAQLKLIAQRNGWIRTAGIDLCPSCHGLPSNRVMGGVGSTRIDSVGDIGMGCDVAGKNGE